ncbi:MAG TPA: class I SAM-dependent methyltransferase [Armatimonadota bacterium]|jgi:SAM-dependent methyltransferase
MRLPDNVQAYQGDFEAAMRWALAQPDLARFMRDCYVTEDTEGDARRFAASEEFAETLERLRRLGRGPGQGLRLLDFGCGSGIAAFAFSQAGYQVTATDLCDGTLAGTGAARKLHAASEGRLRVLDGPWSREADPQTYHVVYCRQVLHHLDSHLTSLVGALADSLTPGGVLAAVREQVIWSEAQRARLKKEHLLNALLQDEDGFYLREYQSVLRGAGLRLAHTLWPQDSAINTYPLSLKESRQGGVLRKLGPAGLLLSSVPPLERPALRLCTYLARNRHPWHVFSFFAVKPEGGRG